MARRTRVRQARRNPAMHERAPAARNRARPRAARKRVRAKSNRCPKACPELAEGFAAFFRTLTWPFSTKAQVSQRWRTWGTTLSGGRIPVDDFHVVSRLGQPLLHIFSDHYRAVFATGAAEGDRQITLAFLDVMRDQVDQQI